MNIESVKKEVDRGILVRSHTSLCRRYVSRKAAPPVEVYSGRFGQGFKVFEPNSRSCRYSFVTYYVRPKGVN